MFYCVIMASDSLAMQQGNNKELWGLLKQENPKPNVDDVFELAGFSLNREIEWIQKSKERLSSITYSTEPQFDSNAISLRKAYDLMMISQQQRAIEVLDRAVGQETKNETKGYLLQIEAKYTNFIDRTRAQQILLVAREKNIGVLAPISGIRYDRAINNVSQAKAICKYISEMNFTPNDYVLHVNAMISGLVFSPDANGFENALQKSGELIGFVSTRPDKETNGEGPDNLRAIGNNQYLVIECKSAATDETNSKD